MNQAPASRAIALTEVTSSVSEAGLVQRGIPPCHLHRTNVGTCIRFNSDRRLEQVCEEVEWNAED